MAKRDTFYKLGKLATIPAFIILGLLLLVLFVPTIDRVINKETAGALLGILFLIFGSTTLLGRMALPALLTGELYVSVIPGFLNSEVPPFLARVFGFLFSLMCFIGLLLGLVMLPVIIADIF